MVFISIIKKIIYLQKVQFCHPAHFNRGLKGRGPRGGRAEAEGGRGEGETGETDHHHHHTDPDRPDHAASGHQQAVHPVADQRPVRQPELRRGFQGPTRGASPETGGELVFQLERGR